MVRRPLQTCHAFVFGGAAPINIARARSTFAVAGQRRLVMSSEENSAVTTQPRSKRKEIEQFVKDLDPTLVVGE